MAIFYEWIVEFLEDGSEDSDIYDTSAMDTYAEAHLAATTWETTPFVRIGLTRNEGNDIEGLTDRMWAYIKEGKLDEWFNQGTDFPTGVSVPKRYMKELENFHKAG
jgi:hypothetical protein